VKARINSQRVAKVQLSPDLLDDDPTPMDLNPMPENTTP
jgi:hypothetical protein